MGAWLSELVLSHISTLEWMGCSDGCLNRLIGLASREIRTDGEKDRMREKRKREQKVRQRENGGAQNDGDGGLDGERDGERRIWPLITFTMGSMQSNQSSVELCSGPGPQSLTAHSKVHCPLLIDYEGRTNLG